MGPYPQHKGNFSPSLNTNRLHSRAVWEGCPLDGSQYGVSDGLYRFEDFGNCALIGTQTTQIAYHGGKVFATSGAAVTPVSSVNSVDLGGGILAFTHAADNDSAAYGDAYPQFKITGSAATSGKLRFEARVATKSILTLRNGFMLGLGEVNQWTYATAVPLNADAGLLTNSGSFIGFNKFEIIGATTVFASKQSVSGGINTSYTDRATAFTAIGADDYTGQAAFTFVKLGFVYDPTDAVNCVKFYANGVQLAHTLTRAAIVATTNLKANSLGMMLVSIAAASVSTDATYLDWWACHQEQ